MTFILMIINYFIFLISFALQNLINSVKNYMQYNFSVKKRKIKIKRDTIEIFHKEKFLKCLILKNLN